MPNKLVNIDITEVSGVDKAANKRRFLIIKRAEDDDMEKADKPMKTEGGVQFPAEAYAYVPDPEKPSTWKLRLWETPETKETARQVGMAVAALGPGFRGNKVEIPAEDLPKVKAKVRAAWKKVNPDKSDDEMPAAIKKGGDTTDEVTLKERLWGFVKGLFGPGDPADAGEAKDLNEILAEEQRDEILWRLTSALRESLDSILEDDTVPDKQAAIGQVLQQFLSALVAGGVTKAGRKISTSRLAMLKQMKDMLDQLITEAEASSQNADMNMGMGMSKRKEEGPVPDKVIKMEDLPEDIRKQLEEVAELKKKAAEAEELKKRVEEAEALAKAEREERLKKEYIAKVASYQALPVQPEEFGLVLKALAEKAPEEYAKLEGVLKAADEALAKSELFREVGRSGAGESTAWAKVEAMAKEIVQKNAGMTKEQAIAKVLRDNPELYSAYRAETEGKVK